MPNTRISRAKSGRFRAATPRKARYSPLGRCSSLSPRQHGWWLFIPLDGLPARWHDSGGPGGRESARPGRSPIRPCEPRSPTPGGGSGVVHRLPQLVAAGSRVDAGFLQSGRDENRRRVEGEHRHVGGRHVADELALLVVAFAAQDVAQDRQALLLAHEARREELSALVRVDVVADGGDQIVDRPGTDPWTSSSFTRDTLSLNAGPTITAKSAWYESRNLAGSSGRGRADDAARRCRLALQNGSVRKRSQRGVEHAVGFSQSSAGWLIRKQVAVTRSTTNGRLPRNVARASCYTPPRSPRNLLKNRFVRSSRG
ncbi:MAG: hypothetical protein QOI11_1367, partial [Candidatus Eremiobacteraeota bacterium]|nr:hypothetical protein [Candidatus Eremiobacteraeota bacterium]